MTAFSDALTEANLAQEAAKQKTLLKDQAREDLEAAWSTRASYIETESEGDASVIMSANLQIRAGRAPVGPLTAPIDFLATKGDMDGEIDVIWSRVKGAKTYIIQISPYDGPRTWTQAAVVTKSKASIDGLTSGVKYVFRVCAVGSAGNSPWSDESVQMAP